jgi:GNAT superfamily N-acetyltransferase
MMAQEILSFPGDALPLEFKWQILSFLRVQWPEGFRGRLQSRERPGRNDLQPVHFLLVEQSFVISHAAVVWKYLDHAGQTYKVYGLSNVFTFPDHERQGCGKRIVDAATEHIRASENADVAMLWCQANNRSFYEKCGWICVEDARTLLTAEDGTVSQFNATLMMLFLSEKGQQAQSAFWKEPIYFGRSAW